MSSPEKPKAPQPKPETYQVVDEATRHWEGPDRYIEVVVPTAEKRKQMAEAARRREKEIQEEEIRAREARELEDAIRGY